MAFLTYLPTPIRYFTTWAYYMFPIKCTVFFSTVSTMEEASIALNKQEIRITRYIRKRVTVLTLLVGK